MTEWLKVKMACITKWVQYSIQNQIMKTNYLYLVIEEYYFPNSAGRVPFSKSAIDSKLLQVLCLHTGRDGNTG